MSTWSGAQSQGGRLSRQRGGARHLDRQRWQRRLRSLSPGDHAADPARCPRGAGDDLRHPPVDSSRRTTPRARAHPRAVLPPEGGPCRL